ncbi:MAG: hypothetical protein ACMXYF_01245 [Candidatus Woesearchaeota archaeon]
MKLDNIIKEIVLDTNTQSGFRVEPFVMDKNSPMGRMLANIPINVELDSEDSGLYLCRLEDSEFGLTTKYGLDAKLEPQAFNTYDIKAVGRFNPELQIRPKTFETPGFTNPTIRLDLLGWDYAVSQCEAKQGRMPFDVNVDWKNLY